MSNTDSQYLTGTTTSLAYNAEEFLLRDAQGVMIQKSYINYTKHAITVVERDGLKQVINHSPNKYTGHFIVRTEYYVPADCADSVHEFLIKYSDEIGTDIKAFKDGFLMQWKPSQRHNFKVVVDCSVYEDYFHQSRHLYIENRDILISLDPVDSCPNHPFSSGELLLERYKELTENKNSIGFLVEIVDNQGDLAPRYLFASKRLFRVTPREDRLRESGVYIGYTDFQGGSERITHTERLTLEEATEKIGLYKTREEAVSGGDVKALRSEEILKLGHEMSIKNIELQRLQQENKEYTDKLKMAQSEREHQIKLTTLHYEEKIAEINRHNKVLEAEVQKQKAEFEKQQTIREESYSQASHQRKEQSDWFKFVTAIVVGGLAIFGAIFKLTKK